MGEKLKEWYIGEEVVNKGYRLDIKCPIKRGIIEDWDNMEKIYDHSFSNLLKT
jgi:actin-related protein